MSRVALTGVAGKLGQAVARHLTESGWTVLGLDQHRPDDVVGEFVQVDLTDYGQVAEVIGGHRRRARGGRRGRAPRRDAGSWPAVELGDLRQQRPGHLERLRGVAGRRDQARRVGVQRDRARAAVRRPSALRAGGRGVRRLGPSRRTPWSRRSRRRWPRHFCRWDPELDDGRPALLQRDGPRGLRAVPVVRRRPGPAAAGTCGATSTPATVPRPCAAGWSTRCPGPTCSSIANADTVMSRSSAELVAEVYPGVEVRRELGEHETLLCIDKARRVLGYEPEHSWRDEVGAAHRS